MTGPADVSFWLADAGDALEPRPALDGTVGADVAILGAGFTGLWTAWYLTRRDPSLRIVVCDAEVAGWGASGRNGAWCAGNLGVTPGELARRVGVPAARRTLEALRDTVDEVGRVCAETGLDAAYRKGGVLRVARGSHELQLARRTHATLAGLGLADGIELLDARALQERVRVAGAHGALFDPNAATVHPGRLVRGLARLVERAGVTVYEHTPVTGVVGGAAPRLRTARGDVRAGTVVLAGEAYLTRLPGWRRRLLPVYSLIVLTEPLDEGTWREIGWQGGECLSSHRYTIDYLSRTPDGRILFGGRGAPYRFASRIDDAYDRHGPTHARLRQRLAGWFPTAAGARITHAWGGPVALPRDWMPTIHHDPARGLAGAWGYGGQGVAASNLAGRTLADLITGAPSPRTTLPIVGHRSRRWEPEPLRWLGVRAVQRALERVDARAQRTGRTPTGRTLPERLVRH